MSINPERASKPAQSTYSKPGPGFGQNQSAVPSSVSVTDSASMSGNMATKGDAVLESLKSGGFGDRSETGSPIADLQRKIDTTQYPAAGFGTLRNRSGEGAQVPAQSGATSAPPVRSPSK